MYFIDSRPLNSDNSINSCYIPVGYNLENTVSSTKLLKKYYLSSKIMFEKSC